MTKKKTSVSTTNFKDCTWMSTSFLCCKAYQVSNVKAYVFSETVLCEGKWGDDLVATWKTKIKCFFCKNHFEDMKRIDGMPTEFEWKIFTGITTLGFFQKGFKNFRQIYSVNRSTSKAGLSSCPCLTTLYGMQKEATNNVYTIHRQLRNMLANSSGSLVFLEVWIRRKMVRNLKSQTRWIIVSDGRRYVGIRSSNISCLQCF